MFLARFWFCCWHGSASMLVIVIQGTVNRPIPWQILVIICGFVATNLICNLFGRVRELSKMLNFSVPIKVNKVWPLVLDLRASQKKCQPEWMATQLASHQCWIRKWLYSDQRIKTVILCNLVAAVWFYVCFTITLNITITLNFIITSTGYHYFKNINFKHWKYFLSIENNFLVKLYLEFYVSFANNSF